MDPLEQVFRILLAHVRRNPELAREIEAALTAAPAAVPARAAPPSPAPSRAPAPPPPPQHRPPELDPFEIYEIGWETMLRERLGRLQAEQLRDVIHHFKLDPRGRMSEGKNAANLLEFIVEAVLDRQRTD